MCEEKRKKILDKMDQVLKVIDDDYTGCFDIALVLKNCYVVTEPEYSFGASALRNVVQTGN